MGAFCQNSLRLRAVSYFHKKFHFNEISEEYYRETRKNSSKLILFGLVNSCLQNFVNFQGKDPRGSAFLNKVEYYLTPSGNVFMEVYKIL